MSCWMHDLAQHRHRVFLDSGGHRGHQDRAGGTRQDGVTAAAPARWRPPWCARCHRSAPADRGRRIVAAAQFRCDAPGPDRLTVTVQLQRNDGGTWTTLTKESFVSNLGPHHPRGLRGGQDPAGRRRLRGRHLPHPGRAVRARQQPHRPSGPRPAASAETPAKTARSPTYGILARQTQTACAADPRPAVPAITSTPSHGSPPQPAPATIHMTTPMSVNFRMYVLIATGISRCLARRSIAAMIRLDSA